MRVLAGCIAALCLIASPAMAGANGAGNNGGADSAASAKSANASSAAPAKPETVTAESELQQLKDLIDAQSKQLRDQQQQLNEQKQQMESLKQQLNSGSSNNSAVAAAPVLGTAAIGPVVGVSTASVAAVAASPAAQAPAAAADQPASIKYKGVTLTPGGFFAGEMVWHQKAMAADDNTPFNSVPLPGASAAHISEFNAGGRQTRISMLVQGKISSANLLGYYEMDFLGAGVTSNNNQSNSYVMRQRQAFGQVAFNNGVTLTAGHMWSLVTETATGMNNRTEAVPLVIDHQYSVGFSWARQFGLRVTKNFNNKIWLGASIEGTNATLTAHGNPTVNAGGSTVCTNATCTTTALINPTVNTNFVLGSFGNGGGLYNATGNYQFNPSPDFIVKAVFEPGFGHYEVFGIVREFRDRVFPCVPLTGAVAPAGCASITSAAGAHNDTRTGGGGGVNARWTFMAKKVDFGVHFFAGDGIGRYGSAGLADVTTRPDGTLAPIRNYQSLGTLQFHPTPKLDVYFNVGNEYESRVQYTKAGAAPTFGGVGAANNEGYGALGFSNAGCWTETLPLTGPSTSSNTGVPTGVGGSTGFLPGPLGSCTADTRNITEGTVGFWYRFYNGPMGRFQWGMQFSDYVRNTWKGVGAAAGSPIGVSGQPAANQNMAFASFRYYLP